MVTTDPAQSGAVFLLADAKMEGSAAQSSSERGAGSPTNTCTWRKTGLFTQLQLLRSVQRENLNNTLLSFHYLGEIITTSTVQARILLPNILAGNPGEHILNAASPLEKMNKLHC